MFDIAYFPHVFDCIVDELYRALCIDTLLALRQTSTQVRDMVDRKLRSHLVVSGKQHQKSVNTRWGRLRPEGSPKARVVDVHHFNWHRLCNYGTERNELVSCETEETVADYVRAAGPDVIRLFDSRTFVPDACGASTLVQFTKAGYFFGAGVKHQLVPSVDNVINIRHKSNVGLFEVLWGSTNVCMECAPSSPSPAPTREVVILFTPQGETSEDPPENPDRKWGLLNSIVVSAITYLRSHQSARLTLVGTEHWSVHWFQLWPVDPLPDPEQTHDVRRLWDVVFRHFARTGWTCAPHYAEKSKCVPLSEDEIQRLQGRIEFVSVKDYRDRVGDERFVLYTVE